MMRFLKLWLPVLLWCGLIFYLSSIPSLQTGLGMWDFILRKIAHISEYFILTLLLYRAFKESSNLARAHLTFCSAGLSFLYAISDEIHQAFVPTRFVSFGDVLIDTLGIFAFYIFLKYRKRAF